MTEWIILVWLGINPFAKGTFCETVARETISFWQVSITSTTKDFEDKWNSLSGEERKTATIYKGNEYEISNLLIKKSFSEPIPEIYGRHFHCGKLMVRIEKNRWVCRVSKFVFVENDNEDYDHSFNFEEPYKIDYNVPN